MEVKKWGRGGEEKQEINAVGSYEQPFNRPSCYEQFLTYYIFIIF